MIMESSFYFFLFSLLTLCHLMTLSRSFTSSLKKPRCHDDEKYALLQFKNSFVSTNNCDKDDYPIVETWKFLEGERGDCCSWDGVECDDRTDHVTSLDFSSSCLFGSINSSSTLFSLVHLQRLNLAFNNFNFSQIPSKISNLSSLTYLNLSYSRFSGQIPSQLSNITTLISLDLSDYSTLELHRPSLKGLVQQMINLKELHLSQVEISSSVPDLLANFSSLESLRLDGCDLIGEFPRAIFHLPNLKILDLSYNSYLRGFLPKFRLQSPLKSLMLSYTIFGGELPPSIGNLAYLKHLHISSCNFTGQLPFSIGNLTQLVSLYMSENHFNPDSLTTSSFSWIGKLTKLSVLYLDSMNLEGEIPSSLMNLTQLYELAIPYNQLIGPIPPNFMNLIRLKYLHLSNNQLSSSIPPSLMNLTQLNHLDLSNNQLSGPITPNLMNLTQLNYLDLSKNHLSGQILLQINHLIEYLYLSYNNLEGSIPTNFSNLHNLKSLSLEGNRFAGSVELGIFFQLKNVLSLTLSYNNLSLTTKNTSSNAKFPNLLVLGLASCHLSEFPKFLHNQNHLEFLDLSDNNIRGQIPSWIYQNSFNLNLSHNLLTSFDQDHVFLQRANIHSLDLRYNMLQGSLPIPPSSISTYLISNNNLSGEVPPFICSLTSLETLDLSFNNLSGKLPPCLSNFTDSLSVLDLKGNKFDGNIPSTWRNRCQLRMISMSHNELQGKLPKSLANCSLLEFVDFGNNQIIDSFPFWLGTIPQLSVLILRSNSFHGVINDSKGIGFSNLRVIDLSHNNFSGKLPSNFIWNPMKASNASHIMAYMEKSLQPYGVWVSASYDSFDYSMTIYNKGLEMNYMKIPDIFNAIDFSYNKFQEQIPDIIGNLRGLQLLNLSGNRLSGHIPFSFSNMKSLECLDLSQNQLSGQISMQLTKLTSLSAFDVSFNNLSGPIPLGNQFCTFDPKSYEGNIGLSIATWTEQCGNFKSMPQPKPQPPSIAKDEDSESEFKIKWIIISIGFIGGLVVGVIAGNEFTRRKHFWFVKTFGTKQRKKGRGRRSRSIRNGN